MYTATGWQLRCGRRGRPGENGLTLVELLLVLALLGVVLAGIFQYWQYGNASWERTAAEGRATQEARLALMRMEREVRQAQKATETKESIHLVSSTEVEIYTDVTGDGKPEMVVYRLQGDALQRGVAAPSGSSFPYTYGAPVNWDTVVSRAETPAGQSLFTLDESHKPRLVLTVNLVVADPQVTLARPVSVQAVLTVRGRTEAK